MMNVIHQYLLRVICSDVGNFLYALHVILETSGTKCIDSFLHFRYNERDGGFDRLGTDTMHKFSYDTGNVFGNYRNATAPIRLCTRFNCDGKCIFHIYTIHVATGALPTSSLECLAHIHRYGFAKPISMRHCHKTSGITLGEQEYRM